MRATLILLSLISLILFSCKQEPSETLSAENQVASQEINAEKGFAIVIHGGAGTIKKENMTAEQEVAYREKLQEALDAGYKILDEGGSGLDAVQKAINVMEDSPLFNAGKGAVFNSLGKNELDASIMDGKTLNTGAVAGVKRIKNPINAARIVMDSTRHVMMVGKGAEDFSKLYGIEFVEDDYFHTEKRYNQLLKAQEREQVKLDHSAAVMENKELIDDHKFGTVGAVALDKEGNIAAATSTGGMTNKKYGRVGDVPIIGAGTYANNKTCGISATGTGEYFIRAVATHEVSSLMKYNDLSLKAALDNVIDQVGELGGSGGMVALDKDGNIAWSFNSAGMYRGYKKSDGKNSVKFYEE